jgi:pyridoxamine 5'-phosphate oxidase
VIFLGIDFGWQSKPSGVAALAWNGSSLHLTSLELLRDPAQILAWVEAHAEPDAVAGIDAPIVIPNATGMRPADKLAHAYYGKYHAGAYPASRARSYWERTTGLSAELARLGFVHGDRMPARASGRYQIEVHPHAATVQLYGLDRIVKYKRGTLAARVAGLAALRALIQERLPHLTPRLAPQRLPPIPSTGPQLKALEDQLDAITCAYVAAHWWYWGLERNDVLGDSQSGYIVVPKRQPPALSLADLRENYARTGLLESEVDPNPISQFEKWFAEVQAAGLNEPNAMTLATVSPDGQPSARIVLLKGLDESGFVFYGNYGSRKGRELSQNPHAALVFYWAELERQVRVTGRVERTSRAQSERYFHSRPRGSQLGAFASQQSAVIDGRAELETIVAQLEAEYESTQIPLPRSWGGFRLKPLEIEFWQGRPSRLHDRIRYRKQADGRWIIERLAP